MPRYRTEIVVLWLALAFSGMGFRPPPEANPAQYVSPEAGRPYAQDARDLPRGPSDATQPTLPPELSANAQSLTLTQLVDAALQLNPSTRAAWAKAKAAAAGWAVARSPYYPSVNGSLNSAAGRVPATLGGSSYFNSSSSISYLLLDFGGRSAAAESARQALVAANWNHNQAIQDTLRNVPQAFYALLGNKALVHANKSSLADAQTSLASAEERLAAGAATIADVLQARANRDQARYNLASAEGSVEISRGQLAQAVGLPSNTRFDVAAEFDRIPVRSMGDDIDALIERARADRPDLNAAIASVRQSEAQVKKARALPFPQLTGTGNFQWQVNRGGGQTWGTYAGGGLTIPIFDGFSMRNQLRQSRAQLEAARENLRLTEENVVQQVWSAHYNFTTAGKQFESARSLLASASESYSVSLARYRAGAANIVELMTTQAQLAQARAQLIGARQQLYTSYAELVHAIGAGLDTPAPGEDRPPLAVDTAVEEKDIDHGSR